MPSFSSQLLLTTAASSSGLIPLADIDLIKGAFKVYPNLGTLQNENVTFFTDKQVVMTGDTGRLYQATVTLADFITVFEDSASFTEFSFTGLTADVPDGTISGSAQIAALGYILSSQTSSFVLSSQTSSFALKSEVSGAFTAASSSISTRLTSLEAGGGSVPAGTISGSQQITDLGFVNQSQTSSMSVLSSLTASYIDPTFISASAAAAGFGSGGGTATDISALNAFTSSIQTEVNNLTAETSSYALKTEISGAFTQDSASISTRLTSLEAGGGNVPAGTISGSQQITDLGFINQSQTSSMSVLSAETASFISDTFISASAARSGFGSVTLPSGVVSSSAQTIANLQGTGILSGSSSVPAGTISGSQQITDLGFINQSQTSSMSVATASYVDPTFISASAAAAGFGTATLPSGVLSSSAQIAVEISGAFTSVSGGLAGRITTLEGTSGGDVTALNLFTGSIQTQVDNLTAETSSYLTSADTASFITISQTSSMSVLNAVTASYIDPTFISASAAAAGFGSGGGTTTDISALNTFTGSAQTSLTALNSATSSYITNSQTSSMSVATASYIDPTFISASAAAAGFGSGGGSTDISALNTFTSSIQTQVDSLTSVTSSYATTGSNNFIGNQDVSGSLVVSDYISTDNVLYTNAIEENLTNGGITFVGGGFGFAFNNNIQVTGSIVATSFTGSLEGTSSWAENVLTASYIDPTFISASAAAAGFGSGGGSVPAGTVSSSAQTIAHLQGTGIISASSSVPAGTVSGSQQITDLGFINQSQTSSMLVGTASLAQTTNEVRFLGKGDNASYYISFTNVSAGSLPYSAPLFTDNASGLAYNPSTNLIQNANLQGNVTGSLLGTASYVSPSTIVSGLVGQDVVVSSITAETFIVSSSVSFITTSFSSGSTKFGDDLLDTHIFTGSVSITGSLNIGGPFTVNNENLNVSSGSIILTNSSSIVVLDSGIISGTFVGNLNYDYITNLPNLISSSAQIAALGAGLLSSSAQIASDISGAFTSLSSSFASRITALEAGGGGSGIFALTGSFYSTTNNIQITGSLSVGSGSFKAFEVDTNGFVVLGDMDKDLNTAPVGTIVYSGSNFYLIS